MEPFHKARFVEQLYQVGIGVFNNSNWSKGEIFIKNCLNNRIMFTQCNMNLHCALAVSQIMDFLLGQCMNVEQYGRDIMISHMLECELPELLVFIWIQLGVVTGVFVTAAVAKPNIVVAIGQQEGGRFALIIDNPPFSAVQQSMLQQNRLKTLSYNRSLPLDAEDCQNISVLSGDFVCLDWIFEVSAVVNKGQLGLRVNGSVCQH